MKTRKGETELLVYLPVKQISDVQCVKDKDVLHASTCSDPISWRTHRRVNLEMLDFDCIYDDRL